jgi:hypothetical protein
VGQAKKEEEAKVKPKAELDQQLKKALENFYRARDKKVPVGTLGIAVGFLDAEPELVREWNIATVERMVHGLVRKISVPAQRAAAARWGKAKTKGGKQG